MNQVHRFFLTMSGLLYVGAILSSIEGDNNSTMIINAILGTVSLWLGLGGFIKKT